MVDSGSGLGLGITAISVALGIIGVSAFAASSAEAAPTCARTVTAQVVALDQQFMYNRIGAVNPGGMIFALRRDVVDMLGVPLTMGGSDSPGAVFLRPDKRPRPIVLRMNAGDCLEIEFQNLLNPIAVHGEQPATRTAGIHVTGLQAVDGIASVGTNVGANVGTDLAEPGEFRTYKLYTDREATYLMYSPAATTGGEGDGGSLAMGLFGAVNVEPASAEWYRSQVTEEELRMATTGTTPDGQPIINYDATYPLDCEGDIDDPIPGDLLDGVWCAEGKAGLPILNMLTASNEIVHSDLYAIITGPGRGNFPAGTYGPNPVMEPNATLPQATAARVNADLLMAYPVKATRPREEPFRESTAVFHDEIFAVQAFNEFFEDETFGHTLHGVRDGFAINYGTGGAGAEVLANRIGVGPMWNCTECAYEEFFLSAWAVGDPSMVVDNPANIGLFFVLPGETPDPSALGPQATKAFYPDDPSNVVHAYIGDHFKFRNVHAGPKEHHIFHLHAHQWLFSADSDKSSYLDSQAIGPGSNYTYDITYNGGGNRNQAVGDAIYHCHFYPHFAQGMWALWRNHDVMEVGTRLEVSGLDFHAEPFALQSGQPAAGARALPDGEIFSGTPIPAVVPIPTLAMAPMPSAVTIDDLTGQVVLVDETVNPGFPFYIPGIAGHRAPRAPLDIVDDGGLPRHVVTGGTAVSEETRLSFSKELVTLNAVELPEGGTDAEQTAMSFHAKRAHKSYTPAGIPLAFITNGLPAVAGAPYADPCVDDQGNAVGTKRVFKVADIQIDMKLNKAGWHVPQARIEALWGDVAATRNGTRAPEPLFFRAQSGDCIEYHLTSLLPKEYQLDDFQVRSPTDIVGQHIHLVKFDVTASDGATNGWNYEDGVFAPDATIERINAINAPGGSWTPLSGPVIPLVPEAHPFFGTLGAQTMIQRWYADPVLDNASKDRTLETVYTHDHFSPSTHQQTGLYAGLIIEPKGSTWRDPETGAMFGTRTLDGGPTSWRADILTSNAADSHREFIFEFQDFAIAYEAGGGLDSLGKPKPDTAKAIIPPVFKEIGLPFLVEKALECPGLESLPCPEAVSAEDPGTFTVNYRNEPAALRIYDPVTKKQAAGDAGDLSKVFASTIVRKDTRLNVQPTFYPPLSLGVDPKDPFTPLLRTYEGDKVKIRILVGAHEEGHVFTINGLKWLKEPDDGGSGWRNAQTMGISEHFEFASYLLPGSQTRTDYLYRANTSSDGVWQGAWGIMRTYDTVRTDLKTLPNNTTFVTQDDSASYKEAFDGGLDCPANAPVRSYSVTATTAAKALPGGRLVYNSRTSADSGHAGPLNDPTALLYIRNEDLLSGKLRAGKPIEPLILRARAGECVRVQLKNDLPVGGPTDLPGFNGLPPLIEKFNANQAKPSKYVGLHPQLLYYDVTKADGNQVGFNHVNNLVAPGNVRTFSWYAGNVAIGPQGQLVATPIEFGAVNLMPSDPVKHSNKGLVAALIIEPQGSSWLEDATTRAAATVTRANGSKFREFVMLWQDDINFRDAAGAAIENTSDAEDYEDSGQKAINYRSEPMWFRLGFAPDLPLSLTRDFDYGEALKNVTVGGDPVTPVFTTKAGQEVIVRLLEPSGNNRNGVLAINGHHWQATPFVVGAVPSQTIGNNPLSPTYGAQGGIGPGSHFNIVLKSAGGPYNVPGDYLYRDQNSFLFDGGRWGIIRVTP